MKASKPLRALIMITALAILWGCSKSTGEGPSSKEPSEAQLYGGEMEFKGVQVVQGELFYAPDVRTKGNVFIANSEKSILLDEEFFNTAAGQGAQAWSGKKVEIKGDLYYRMCGMYEQCPSTGEIWYMENLQYVELKSVQTL